MGENGTAKISQNHETERKYTNSEIVSKHKTQKGESKKKVSVKEKT